MHHAQFLNNLKYVFHLLEESELPLSSDVYSCLVALYTSYKLNEMIKEKAVDRGLERFKENLDLKRQVEELTRQLADLTDIK